MPFSVTAFRSPFLLTPLREGRLDKKIRDVTDHMDFYSRPCGRGDTDRLSHKKSRNLFLLTPLREGRQQFSTSPS